MRNVVSNSSSGLGQEGGSSRSTKHTVIQCPKCQTKFAVDAKLIMGLEAPKFHCSRCDHVFSSSEFNQSYLPFKELQSSLQSNSGQDDSLELKQTVQQAKNRLSSKSLEIPKEFAIERRTKAPHESEPVPERDDQQVTFDFFEDKPFEPEASFKSHDISFSDFPKSSIESALQDGLPTKPYPGLKRRTSLSKLFQNESRWFNLALLVIPLAVLLLILTATSIYISLSGNNDNALAFIMPTRPLAPPLGLFIQNTKLETIVLDSGEKARVIKGTVVNDSDTTLRDLVIEALLFDKLGQQISNIRVNLSASLAEARIKALSPDMINELQKGRISKQLELSPGDQSGFALVITDASVESARFYSARVHSVIY